MKGQSGILFTAFGGRRFQAVAFPHGDTALNQKFMGVVYDAVHDCLGNWAAGVKLWVNVGIPTLGLVLGAKGHSELTAGLHDFQQVVGLLWRERPDEPLVQDQQVNLLVGGQTFLQLAAASGNTQLVEKLRHTDIANLLEAAAGGVVQGTGNVGLAVAGGAFKDDIVALVHKFAGGEAQHLSLVQLSVLVVGNLFHHSEQGGKVCAVDEPLHRVGLAAVSLGSHQQP